MATKIVPYKDKFILQAECDVCASEIVFCPKENGEAYCFEHSEDMFTTIAPRKYWLRINDSESL